MAVQNTKPAPKKVSFRLVALILALIVLYVGSSFTTIAGVFHKPSNRVVYLTQNSLTITITGNQSTKIYPGMEVGLADKATITVPANQPNCYVFIKITEANDTNNIVSWAMGSNFSTNPETGIYRATVKSSASAQSLPVFSYNKLDIATSATLAQIQAATTTPITVTIQACAVQSDNISEAAALTVAKGQFNS